MLNNFFFNFVWVLHDATTVGCNVATIDVCRKCEDQGWFEGEKEANKICGISPNFCP